MEIPCEYIEELKNEINKTIDLAIKENYKKSIFWPLEIFIKYLNDLNNKFQNVNENINKTKIKQNINISKVRLLKLFEKLNMNNLFLWDYIDLLQEKNIEIFILISNLHKILNLPSLGLFFKELTKNIILINEILNIFPYSKFQKTKLSILNNIMTYIIKSAANKKINFVIKIENEDYYFKFIEKESEKINFTLDLNMENDKLIITKNTKIMLPSINKDKPFDGTNKIKKESLNNYYIILIEKIINSEKFGKNEFKQIYKEILYKINDKINEEIKENRFDIFFKNSNNLINYIWSILFLDCQKFNEEYLLYFLNKEKEKSNIEKDIFLTFCNLYNRVIKNDNQNNNDIEEIINFSTALSKICESNTILYKLSYDKKYIFNKEFKSIEETKKFKNNIQSELERLEYFISNFKKFSKTFQPYATLLDNEIMFLKNKINEMEIDDYKTRIKYKIEGNFKQQKLLEKLLKELNDKNSFENLREFESLIEEYIISYDTEKEKENDKIKIFCINDDYNEMIIKYNKKDQKNLKNDKLIELLLKYSEIKEIIEYLISEPNEKLIKLQKLNEIINEDYIDFINSFFVSEFDNNQDKITIIKSYIYSMFVQELFDNNLEENFVELTHVLNNLYEIENFDKFDNTWCTFIEGKYYLNSKIYIFELNYVSLLFLFIKIKDSSLTTQEKGFLIDYNFMKEESELIENLFVEFQLSFNDLRKIKNLDELLFALGKKIGEKLEIFSKIENEELMGEEMQNYLKDNEIKIKIGEIFSKIEKEEKIESLKVIYEEIKNYLKNSKENEIKIKIGEILSKIEKEEKIENIKLISKDFKNYLDQNKSNEIKIKILKNYLRVKRFYKDLNKKREILEFNDIDKEKNRKKLFSNNYAQLINYLNYNNDIYENLINEPTISSFYPSTDFIPLWLICLRVLSNLNNIKVSFQIIDEDIARFEYEFQYKIKEIIKNNNRNNNIDWILLITPNKIGFCENKDYEKLYKLFNYLLSMFTNFNIDNKFEIFETIKKFIFDTFENIYKKGNKYFLTENLNAEDIKTNNINIFTLNTKFTDIIDNINKKIMIEFNSNKKFLKLKYIFENLINEKKYESFKSIKTRLVEGIKKYEKYYNRKLVEKEIDSIYKDMELICKHYNNLVEKYKNSGIKSKEAQNDFNDIKKKVQSYIDSKDAYYEGSFFNFFKSKEGKVQIIDRNEYIDKKEKEINIDKFEIIFGEELGIIEFFDEFENIIQKIEEILTLVKISNKSNIEQLISKLKKFKRFTEPKKEMFKIDIKDKDI